MILFYLLISVMPLSQHRIWAQFIGELTVIKYLGAACLLYAVLHMGARRQQPPFFQTGQACWFVFLVLLAMASFLFMGAAGPWETSPFLSYASFLLLFFITLVVVDSLQRLRWVLLVSIGSVAFASLYVIREWQKYHDVYWEFRPGWVVGDPNYFTVSALAALPLGFYVMLERRPRWERLYCLGCLLVTLLGVTLAASRGGFLGLIAAFLFVVWRSRQRVRNLALAGMLLVPLTLVSPASPIERLLQPTQGDQEAADLRKAIWKAGLRIIREHPISGIGLGNFKPRVGAYGLGGEQLKNVAHNTYIEIAAEMGLPSLLAFLAILAACFQSLERVRRQSARSGPSLLQQASLGIQGGLVGCAVSLFFVSAQYQKLFWLMVFLSMCLPPLAAEVAAGQARAKKQEADKVAGVWGTEGTPARRSPAWVRP